MRRLYNYFSSPKKLSILNALLICAIIIGNIFIQVFCIPTLWASIIIFISFSNIIISPLINVHNKFYKLVCFINGFSIFICVYCILFLEHANWFGFVLILFLGLGLLTFVPHFFVIQLLIKGLNTKSRKWFISGIITPCFISMYIGIQYHNEINAFKEFQKTEFNKFNKTYLAERILGMHFIYHTKISEYDGWRPPFHDPILNIGMWLNNREDPLNIKLEDRIKLYKKLYPQNIIKFNCSCAVQYSDMYYNDRLLE